MLNKRVIWSEGMYLQPQHLQQHDRHTEYLIQQYARVSPQYNWGLSALEINRELLLQGKIGLNKGQGIFPDGTVFDIPYVDTSPSPLSLSPGVFDVLIYLTLPLRSEGIPETKSEGMEEDKPYRYKGDFFDVVDNSAADITPAQLQLGTLNLSLKPESDDLEGYTSVGIACIKEVEKNGNILLDEDYIPPSINLPYHPRGRALLEEVCGLLYQRGETLARYVGGESQEGIPEIQDFLLLQLINRYEPLFKYLSNSSYVTPDQFYSLLIQLTSELSTFTSDSRRSDKIPDYNHNGLSSTFIPLLKMLRSYLSRIAQPRSLSHPLQKQDQGVWIALIDNPSLFKEHHFILAVKASLPNEQILSLFPSQVKIAPIEDIPNLIKHALPGLSLKFLSTTPREIPFHSRFTYFQLETHSPLWSRFENSSALGLHVAGHFPDLELELWSIKK